MIKNPSQYDRRSEISEWIGETRTVRLIMTIGVHFLVIVQ